MLRLGVMTVPQGVALTAARAANRVVIRDRGGRDLCHRTTLVGHQHGTGAQENIFLGRDGVLGAVAFGAVMQPVEEEVDRLVTFQIDDSKRSPP